MKEQTVKRFSRSAAPLTLCALCASVLSAHAQEFVCSADQDIMARQLAHAATVGGDQLTWAVRVLAGDDPCGLANEKLWLPKITNEDKTDDIEGVTQAHQAALERISTVASRTESTAVLSALPPIREAASGYLAATRLVECPIDVRESACRAADWRWDAMNKERIRTHVTAGFVPAKVLRAHCPDKTPEAGPIAAKDVSSECVSVARDVVDLISALNTLNRAILVTTDNTIGIFVNDLRTKMNHWEMFAAEARPMHALDWWATGLYDKGEEGFSGPPKTQILVLHPALAYGYVEDAPDGQHWTGGLILEIFGVNLLDYSGSKLQGHGASVSATYQDIANDSGLGYGLTYTYNNKYSLTVANLGGEASFLFSFDLTELYDTNAKRYEKAREEFKEIAGGLNERF